MLTQLLLTCLLMTTMRDNDVEELGECKRTVTITIRDIVFISYGKIIERCIFLRLLDYPKKQVCFEDENFR